MKLSDIKVSIVQGQRPDSRSALKSLFVQLGVFATGLRSLTKADG